MNENYLEQALKYVIRSINELKAAGCSGTCAYNASMHAAMRHWEGKIEISELEDKYTEWKRGPKWRRVLGRIFPWLRRKKKLRSNAD